MTNATDQYRHLTQGGEVTANLTQEEACSVLAAYDNGIFALSDEDFRRLHIVIAKLKDQIWP